MRVTWETTSEIWCVSLRSWRAKKPYWSERLWERNWSSTESVKKGKRCRARTMFEIFRLTSPSLVSEVMHHSQFTHVSLLFSLVLRLEFESVLTIICWIRRMVGGSEENPCGLEEESGCDQGQNFERVLIFA